MREVINQLGALLQRLPKNQRKCVKISQYGYAYQATDFLIPMPVIEGEGRSVRWFLMNGLGVALFFRDG